MHEDRLTSRDLHMDIADYIETDAGCIAAQVRKGMEG